MMGHYDQVYDYVSGLTIIDTHEHLPDHGSKREKPTDVLREYLSHYFDKDLISAGMPPPLLEQIRNHNRPLMERWRLVEPFWRLAANTGYGRALDLTARGLYGIGKIGGDTLEELDAAFQKALADPDWFRTVFRDKCRIAVSVLDGWVDYENQPWCSDLFAPVWRIDNLVLLSGFMNALAGLEKRNKLRVHSFGDYLAMIDADIETSARLGYCGYKLGLAYNRTLRFERGSYAQASEAFDELATKADRQTAQQQQPAVPRVLQDYCLHRCLQAIEKTGKTLQIHTGLQEGNGNTWANSDPLLLNNLFLQYPGLKFDLFHIGYPHWQSLAALAKNFPNVFIDMCWAHIISPEACVSALMEYLDSVPSNKISAFGGDYLMVDPVYGHQLMARRNVSRALAAKVDQGVFDLDTARFLAHRLFIDNPAALFHLGPANQ